MTKVSNEKSYVENTTSSGFGKQNLFVLYVIDVPDSCDYQMKDLSNIDYHLFLSDGLT